MARDIVSMRFRLQVMQSGRLAAAKVWGSGLDARRCISKTGSGN
jgi:hypothetical protein